MYKFEYIPEQCWYKDACEKYGTNQCNYMCNQYYEMHHLVYQSGIPKAKCGINKLVPTAIDLVSFNKLDKIKQNIYNFVKDGKSLYIYSSNFGNGKTTWAIKLLQAYFNTIWKGNCTRIRGLFVHVPTFLQKCKEAILNMDEEFFEYKKMLTEVDIVVWDDIAANRLTEHDYLLLLTYIDGRLLEERTNIFTGNLNKDELEIAVGKRLQSRIWNESEVIELKGIDERGIKKLEGED